MSAASVLANETEATLTTTMSSLDSEASSEKSTLDYFSIAMSNILLFFLIFGLSATVDVKNLKKQLRNKFAIATGVAMQFLIMPVLGFLTVIALREQGFTKAMGLTLLVVTASPGGSYSNWWCSTFNADLALSVTMTSISSLLSVAMLPANLFLYTYLAYGLAAEKSDTEDDDAEEQSQSIVQAIDFQAIFTTLGIVMAAIVLGLVAGYQWDYPAFHIYANRFGTVCGLLLIVFSLFLSSGTDGSESSFWNQPWSFYVGVASPCLVGIMLANIISRSFKLSKPECVAISIECCYQNVSIATSIAISMFNDPEERSQAVSVPLLYGVVEAVVIGIYCLWAWKVGWTKAPPGEKLWTVISKTYEVTENSADQQNNGTDNDDNKERPKGDGGDDENAIAIDATITATATDTVGLSTTNLKGNDKHGEDSAAEDDKRRQIIARGDLEQGASDGTENGSSSAPSIWSRIFPRALIRWVSSSSSVSSQSALDQSAKRNNSSSTRRNNKRKPKIEANRCRLVSEDNTASTCGITTCSLASSPGAERSHVISSKNNGKPNKETISEIHLVSLQRIEEGVGNNTNAYTNDSRDRDGDKNKSSS